MGFYERRLFYPVMDRILGRPSMHVVRRRALEACTGRVLEIGVGTGLNLPHYPPQITSLTAVGPEARADPRAESRARAHDVALHYVSAGAEGLPFGDGAFDTLVCTFVLCTVSDPAASLREFRRVLDPRGRLVFVEHLPSAEPRVRRLQRLIDRPHRLFACGCSLVRPVEPSLADAGFDIERIEREDVQGVAWPYRHVAHGVAVPREVSP